MCFLNSFRDRSGPSHRGRHCQEVLELHVTDVGLWALAWSPVFAPLKVQGTHFRMLSIQMHFQIQKGCFPYQSVRAAFTLSHKAAVSRHCWITIFSLPSLNFGRELTIFCMRIFSSSNPLRSLSSLSNDFFLEYGIKKKIIGQLLTKLIQQKTWEKQECVSIVTMRLMAKFLLQRNSWIICTGVYSCNTEIGGLPALPKYFLTF